MKIGLIVPTWTTGPLSWREILDICKEAEASGFDALWAADHLLVPSTNEELRKRAGANVYEGVEAEPEGYFECFTTLTALALAIPRLELGSFVACTNYRNPFLLAKIAETLDEVSGGRLVLGLGSGDSAGEHETMGLPFDSPVSRFEEALQILRALFRGEVVNFSGSHYSVRDAQLVPRGPRPNGPPILIGTLNPKPRMLRLVAEYADVWNGWQGYTDASPEVGKMRAEQVMDALREHGRDPSTLVRTSSLRVNVPGSGYTGAPGEKPLSGDPEQMAEVLRGHEALGTAQVQVALTLGGREGVQYFATVIRAYRG